MKKLYELASFCADYQDVLKSLVTKKNEDALLALYHILFSSQELSNSEAMLIIYGGLDSKAFSALKSKMYELLLKVISLQGITNADGNLRYNRTIESMRENLVSMIVLYRGNRTLAIDIMEKSVSSSVKDQFSLNVFEKVRMLTLHYGTIYYNKYKLNKYLEMESKYFDLIKAETKAINYYIDLKKDKLRSFAEISEVEKVKAKKYAYKLSTYNVSSRAFDFYKFQVFVKNFEYNQEYDQLLKLCDEAEHRFSNMGTYSLSSLNVIRQVRLWAFIQLGRYEECIEKGLPELGNRNLSSTNWYSFLHYIVKAYIYYGKFEDAGRMIIYCFNHSNYKKLNSDLKEIVNLHLGYLHLLFETNYNRAFGEELKLPDFKLGKFLNTTPVFSKDKRGINVSILLMHIAFLLQRKDYNAIIDRTDSLNQYAYRYLRKDDSFRSNCMIKMVIQMTKADFNPIRTDRYTADLRKQLGHVTLAGSGENIEVEIIPFEVLWDIMRKTL